MVPTRAPLLLVVQRIQPRALLPIAETTQLGRKLLSPENQASILSLRHPAFDWVHMCAVRTTSRLFFVAPQTSLEEGFQQLGTALR